MVFDRNLADEGRGVYDDQSAGDRRRALVQQHSPTIDVEPRLGIDSVHLAKHFQEEGAELAKLAVAVPELLIERYPGNKLRLARG